jgi:hypothetical protein
MAGENMTRAMRIYNSKQPQQQQPQQQQQQQLSRCSED